MKMMRRFLLAATAFLLACGTPGCDSANGEQKDSQASDTLKAQEPDLPNQPIADSSGGMALEGRDSSAVAAQSASTFFPPESTFSQHFANLQNALFETAYEPDEMAEHEKKPFFSNSRHRLFQRMRIKKPMGTSAGSRIYPRHILKGYQFSSPEEAQKTVTQWLNGTEHSGDSILLGTPVKAVKSPPLLVAIKDAEVFMLQTTCIYTEGDWERIRGVFLGMAKEPGVQYVFSIGCNAGELTYQKP